MILYINTTNNSEVEIKLKEADKELAQKFFDAPYRQAEMLLPEIDKLLLENNLKLKDIKEIEVNNEGGTFTSLRIGIVTANALGFALGIPVKGTKVENNDDSTYFSVVKPGYNADPSITIAKKQLE